jgi:hypothetical protein
MFSGYIMGGRRSNMPIEEVCQYLDVTRQYVYRLLKQKRLVLQDRGRQGKKGCSAKITPESVERVRQEIVSSHRERLARLEGAG